MKRLLWIMLVVAGFGQASWAAEVDYEGRLLDQVEMTAVTEAQYDAFREMLQNYREARNGAVRRVSRQGGDIPTRVRRDLRRLAKRTVKEMGEVLMPEQLPHVEKYLELANEQYMVQAGLL